MPDTPDPERKRRHTRLRKLRVTRVDVVSQGANEHALIHIAKGIGPAIEIPAKQLGDNDDQDDGMTPAVRSALDAMDARVAAITDAVTALKEKTDMENTAKGLADARDAEKELWERSGAVAKAAGVPLDAAMVRVLETDPALARRLQDAPQPAAVEKAAEPVPVGAAGRQLDALADEIVKADGCSRPQAVAKAMDARPDLAHAVSDEQWTAAR